MNQPLTRREKEELLALLEEQHRRREARRLEHERETILANCATLHGFIEEFWYVLEPTAPFVTGWAIKAMCDHLEAVHRGDIQNLLITVPPGMMKSLLVSVFFQAWEWGPKGRPDLRYLASSFSQINVGRDSDKVRKLVASEKYQALWGDRVVKTAKWGSEKFENAAGGNRDCRPFGSLTGGRGDRNLIDDPHSVDSAESPAVRAAQVKTFREGASDRLNDIDRSATIIIMQRLHSDDVAGTILALDVGYVHLNLPMEFEPERMGADGKMTGGPCRTFIRGVLFFEDPRRAEGELLFPERFPPAALAKLKKLKGSYAWAGQYQQRPTPRDGGIFERSWFKPLYAMPAGPLRTVRAWDIGATEGGGDPSAGVRASKTDEGDDSRYIFTDALCGQWSPATLEANLKLTAAADGQGVSIRLPQDPGAAGKGYVLTLVKKLAGYTVRWATATGSKVTRATAMATAAEAGNVYILVTGDPDRDAWIEPWLDQLCGFPAVTHDDLVDASADAFNELALGVEFQWYVGADEAAAA
jgi:predicted phage terminase large subunit-like protein